MDKNLVHDTASATVIRGSTITDKMDIIGIYHMECLDSAGNVKWSEEFDNLVTTQGKNHLLDHGLTGPATAVITRMSLITSGTPVAGDTYAAHAGFAELAAGVATPRGTPAYSAAASGVKSTSAAVSFSIIGTGTVTGAAINLIVAAAGNLGVVADTATASAILYSAGLFASSKSVSNGDTLNVTYSSTLT